MEFFEFASIAEAAFIFDDTKKYLWVCLVIAAALFAVTYVLESIALYTIAKREHYKYKFMAFVPVLNTYYMGVLSDKNNATFRTKPKYWALGAAIAEAVYVALCITYYVAVFKIFLGGYAKPTYVTSMIGVTTVERLGGYEAVNLPESLNWAWWVFANMQNYILYWVQLVYVVLNMFVLVAFFKTYSSPRYLLFSILSVLFPIKAIFMFAVRKNAGKNYMDYLREQQRRQYAMYQEYMRNNGPYGTGAGPNYGQGYGQNYGQNYGAGNGTNNGGDNYYSAPQTPPDDPFDGLGSSSGSYGGDKSQSNHRGGEGEGGSPRGGDPFDM